MTIRLGEVLIASGVLTEEQVSMILEQQAQQHKPFGLLCEQLCGISPAAIEDAWANQYASLTRTIDPTVEIFDPHAMQLVTRRQAWQFRVLPIRFDDAELMIATTQQHLRRALRFANNVLGVPLYFVMANPDALGDALCKHYALPGMSADTITQPHDSSLRAAG